MVPVVALGIYFTFVYDLFCAVEFYYGETKYVMLASVIGALTNVILNAIFIPMYGFIAAAYTTLFSYIFFMFMHFLFMHKVMKKQKITEEIYDIKFLGIFSIALTATIFVSMLTYQNTFVRWIIIFALCIIVFILRNKIVDVMKSMKK